MRQNGVMTITIYSTDSCGYCRAAVRLLTERGHPFTEIDLTHDAALRQEISARAGGYRTVPMIFIGDRFIGGYQELLALDQGGQLSKMLHE